MRYYDIRTIEATLEEVENHIKDIGCDDDARNVAFYHGGLAAIKEVRKVFKEIEERDLTECYKEKEANESGTT